MISAKLNPADHFTLMMDHEIRSSGLAGNFCGLVLELDGVPDRDLIAQYCQQFARRFPRAVARLKHQGRQYAWTGDGASDLPFYSHKLAGFGTPERAREQLFLDVLNRPTPTLEASPVELHLVEETDKSALLLRWFHPVCDAKGAELLLSHLLQPKTSMPPVEQVVLETVLNKWHLWEKAKLAYGAIRTIRRLDRHASILPEASAPAAPRLALRLATLDREQSTRAMAQAVRHTGMAGISLYFIGCLMRALEQTGSSTTGDAYCVPYAMNFRKSKSMSPVFGNQVSFLFAQASRQLVKSREALFAHLREQNKQAIRHRQDYAMLPLMQLGSWLTLQKQGQIVRYSPHGRERSSFWFSYTGDLYPEPSHIAGCAVTGFYQLSPVTMPPALGLLVNRFGGRIMLSFNFIDGCFSSDWLNALTQAVTMEVLGQD